MTKLKRNTTITSMIVLPIVFFIASICIGRFSVPVGDVFKSILTGITGADLGVNERTLAVVLMVRLPRAFQGVLVGASLAASGTAFQSVFRNPLVSSGMLGVSGGAGFGAALSIVLFGTIYLTPFFAFGFGVVAVVLSCFVGRIGGGASTSSITLILGGTIIQSIFNALLSLIRYIATADTQLPAITFWLMGSLASTTSSDLYLASLPMIVGMSGLMIFRWRLDVLSMGDREAQTLGLNVKANKTAVIAFATLATAGAVSVSGIIGWIGLVVPHIGRMIIGNDNKWLMPMSISFGACFMLLLDTICRTLTGAELPLGVVTAIVGGPFFIYLLKKTKGSRW